MFMVEHFDTLCTGLAAVPSKAALVPRARRKYAENMLYYDLFLRLYHRDSDQRSMITMLTQHVSDAYSNFSSVDARKAYVHTALWFRTILELLFNFSSGTDPVPSFEADIIASIRHWVLNVPSTQIVAYIKYYCVAPHARFFANPLPDQPAGGLVKGMSKYRILLGGLGRWMQHLVIQTDNPRAQRFFYSWHQTKRGCAPMDDGDILGTYKKHKKALTKPAAIDLLSEEPRVVSFVNTLDWMCDKLLYKFKPKIPKSVDYEYSHNACFTNGRAKGGQIQAVTSAMSIISPVERRFETFSESKYIKQNQVDFAAKFFFAEIFHFQKPKKICSSSLEHVLTSLDLADIMFDFIIAPGEAFCGHYQLFAEPDSLQRDLRKKFEHDHFHKDSRGFPEIGQFKLNYQRVGYVDREIKIYTKKAAERKTVEFKTSDSYTLLLGTASICHNDSVVVAPILEPLKVRLVSKGDPLTYAASMPMQKQMHSYLKKIPQFQLIGQPLVIDDFRYLSEHEFTEYVFSDPRLKKSSGEGIHGFEWWWESADYSAATDNLNIGTTKIIFEKMLGKLDPKVDACDAFKSICRHVLYEQKLSYPVGKTEMKLHGLEPEYQQNGQLMGSTLSFPVLCVANFCALWMAMNEYCKARDAVPFKPIVDIRDPEKKLYRQGFQKVYNLGLDDIPCKVNGDDLLFPNNAILDPIWRRHLQIFGLTPSDGKCLKHRKLVTINSQQWRFLLGKNGKLSECDWAYTPYFSSGLLIEGSASKVKKGDSVHHLAAAWNKLSEGCFSQVHAFHRFLKIHKEEIRHETKDGLLNLFASPQNGGLGFNVPIPVDGEKPWETKYTRLQRAFAFKRNLCNIGKMTNKPVVCGIAIKLADATGEVFDYSFPNCDANDRSKLFVGCEMIDDEPRFTREDCIPIIDDPDLVTTNSSWKRAVTFDNHIGGDLEPVREWIRPSLKEVRGMMKARDTWRDSELASVCDMGKTLFYQAVIPVAQIEAL